MGTALVSTEDKTCVSSERGDTKRIGSSYTSKLLRKGVRAAPQAGALRGKKKHAS